VREALELTTPLANKLGAEVKFYAGLFLITACTLMLQVIQTRILSVVAWYHLAFFASSMAMFGLTLGAVWVYLRGDRFTEQTLSYDLSYFNESRTLYHGVMRGVSVVCFHRRSATAV